MAKRNVAGVVRSERECDAAERRLHRIDRGGLGFEREVAGVVDALDPAMELIEAANRLIGVAIDRYFSRRLRARGGERLRREGLAPRVLRVPSRLAGKSLPRTGSGGWRDG